MRLFDPFDRLASTVVRLTASVLLAGSCTLASAGGVPESRTLSAEPSAPAPLQPTPAESPDLPPEPTGTLLLGSALSAAIAKSPVLAAFSWETRARDAEVLQAGLRPNPEIATEVEDPAGSGEGLGFTSSQTTLSFAQLIEVGGKREKRVRVATLDRDLAGWDYEAARLGVLTETTRRFVNVLALQERVALASKVVEVTKESLATVRATVEAAATSPVEASRASVAAEQAAIALVRLQHDLDAARTALAASWGGTADKFERADGNLHQLRAPPPLPSLTTLLSANPDLLRWNTEIARREAAVASEKAQRLPNVLLSVGPRYFAENDDVGLVAGFSVPLPVFNRNSGAIAAAENRLRGAQYEKASVEVSANADLREAYEKLSSSYTEIETLRKRAIPAAEAAFSGATQAYRTGRFRFLEVLDAQRTLFELRADEIDALASYHDAAAQIERLTATPLARPE